MALPDPNTYEIIASWTETATALRDGALQLFEQHPTMRSLRLFAAIMTLAISCLQNAQFEGPAGHGKIEVAIKAAMGV